MPRGTGATDSLNATMGTTSKGNKSSFKTTGKFKGAFNKGPNSKATSPHMTLKESAAKSVVDTQINFMQQ